MLNSVAFIDGAVEPNNRQKKMQQQSSIIRLGIVVVFALSMVGCNQNNTSKEENTTDTAAEQKLNMLTFSEFPEEVDGCACYFSNSEREFEEGKYIYVDDYGKNAFVNVGGEMVQLKLSKAGEAAEKRIDKIWAHENYKLSLETKQIGHIDETWQYAGQLTLKSTDGRYVVKEIYGECGC